MSDQTTLSDDELARDDPDLCEHGWSRLHPQSCPECEDESSSAQRTERVEPSGRMIEADPETQTIVKPYWTCRSCEYPERCDRESKCCDILISDEYFAWCMSEQRRCADAK
jgi:hypothetical protein